MRRTAKAVCLTMLVGAVLGAAAGCGSLPFAFRRPPSAPDPASVAAAGPAGVRFVPKSTVRSAGGEWMRTRRGDRGDRNTAAEAMTRPAEATLPKTGLVTVDRPVLADQGPAGTPPRLPEAIEPASPAGRLSNGPDEEYCRLRTRLRRVGQRLTDGREPAVPLRFESLYNPRPRIHHTQDGHIYVTSGLLAEHRDEQALAVLLAREAAEVLVEHERRPVVPEPSTAELLGVEEPLPVDLADDPVEFERAVEGRAVAILQESGFAVPQSGVRSAVAALIGPEFDPGAGIEPLAN